MIEKDEDVMETKSEVSCVERSDGYAITLDHLKQHLRLTHSIEDYYLEELIRVATEALEHYVQRTFLSKTYRIVSSLILEGRSQLHKVHLLFPPIMTIKSVRDISCYDKPIIIKRYIFNSSTSKPSLSVMGGRVIEVIYSAGYGKNSNDIPSPIRHSITMMAAMMYEKRVDVDESLTQPLKLLLQPYRVMSCA